jgi:ubiquinone/menaquinone biosynthesis C-methylase UbiE
MTHNLNDEQNAFIPGLGHAGLTPLYDAALATIFQEWRFRQPLVEAVDAHPGALVLEVGCGTATVSLLIQDRYPQAAVIATDIDGMMLAQAQRKAHSAHSPLALAQASADALPMADGSVDVVVSSLMFHHLPATQKKGMLAEVLRVLRVGGRLELLDFGPPANEQVAGMARALFGGFEHIDINLSGMVPAMIEQAGLVNVSAMNVALGGVIRLYAGEKGG